MGLARLLQWLAQVLYISFKMHMSVSGGVGVGGY